MKKILICTFVAMILVNCDVKPREVKAEIKVAELRYGSVKMDSQKIDNIEYHIYYGGNGYESASIFVINHTKELLEVEKLKKELGK